MKISLAGAARRSCRGWRCFQTPSIPANVALFQAGTHHHDSLAAARSRSPLLSPASSALPARAQQNWPQRPLRILVGTSPGGSPDIIGRLLADKMADRLGQSITVENNTGGGGGIAASMVTHAPPDGYTMTLLTAG